MTSTRFEELVRRIDELRRCFLPLRFDPTGSYEDAVYEYTRAFRVLVHAEFESFVEDRVIEVMDDAVDKWKTSGEVTVILLAAVAYRESTASIPESMNEAASKRRMYPTLAERVDNARTDLHRYARKQNHGIKEKNLLRMLLPIGVQESDLDTAWISDVDTWATARGDAAHQGGKMQVRPDPQKELRAVTRVLEGLRDLDEQVEFK